MKTVRGAELPILKKGQTAAIVRCSNPRHARTCSDTERLVHTLERLGLTVQVSKYLYFGSARERARELMEFYRNPQIAALFDISGGDMANEILPYLDYDIIADCGECPGSRKSDIQANCSGKIFWGYSDLTTVLNAIYAKTSRPSVLYQVRNLVGRTMQDGAESSVALLQQERMERMIGGEAGALFGISYRFLRGDGMCGVVAGGNIRCLLKLAGTPYWPDMREKILLLEAFHGQLPQMTAYLSQLRDIGAFSQVSGVLLGTFTDLEESGAGQELEQVVLDFVPETVPVARTGEIGHGADAKAIWIGKELSF